MKMSDVDKKMVAYVDDNTNTFFYNPITNNKFKVEGLAFFNEHKQYFRLPLNEKENVTEAVWWLSSQPSGGQIRFKTNSKKIVVKIKSKGEYLMCHMPKTGQQGVDLYYKRKCDKEFKFFTCAKFNPICEEFESNVFYADENEEKDIIINLPLYQGLESILIGIDKDSYLKKAKKHKKDGRIVVYGTSITQGGCASRPGMSYTNILSRKLDMEFINLGFSGSGLGEASLAHIINKIDNTKMVILDYDANGGATGDMEHNLEPFIDILRSKNKTIPILVISKLSFSTITFDKKEQEKRNKFYNFQKDMVNKKKNQGDNNIYFFNGYEMFDQKDCDEFSVDGIHQTDLGFYFMAKKLSKIITRILKNNYND